MNIIPNVLNNPIINRTPQNIITVHKRINRNRPPHHPRVHVPQMATLNHNFLNNMLVANSEEDLQAYVNNNNYNNRIVYLRQGDPNTNPNVSVYRIRCVPVLLGQISGIPGEGQVHGIKHNKKVRKSNKKIIKLSKNTKKSNKKVIKVNKKNNKSNKNKRQ